MGVPAQLILKSDGIGEFKMKSKGINEFELRQNPHITFIIQDKLP